jgi:hypothetical protein
MPYDNLFGSFPGTLIHGVVTSVERDKQTLYAACPPGKPRGGTVIYQSQDHERLARIRYDVLVLATGSIWEHFTGFPSDIGQCIMHVEAWRAKFRDADHIVIAGGGAAGMGKALSSLSNCCIWFPSLSETAGELKDIYPVSLRRHLNPMRIQTFGRKRMWLSSTLTDFPLTPSIPIGFVHS